MSTTKLRQVWQLLLASALSCGLLSAQMTVTGTITGTVADPSGQGIAGAKITLTSIATADVRSAVPKAADAKRRGKGLLVIDGLLAATALHHKLTIVTRNVKDFADLGVTVFNPWDTA